MLDMGFLPAIRRVLAMLPTKRQTLLFSATMSSSIEQLARSTMKEPKLIEVNPSRSARQRWSNRPPTRLLRNQKRRSCWICWKRSVNHSNECWSLPAHVAEQSAFHTFLKRAIIASIAFMQIARSRNVKQLCATSATERPRAGRD